MCQSSPILGHGMRGIEVYAPDISGLEAEANFEANLLGLRKPASSSRTRHPERKSSRSTRPSSSSSMRSSNATSAAGAVQDTGGTAEKSWPQAGGAPTGFRHRTRAFAAAAAAASHAPSPSGVGLHPLELLAPICAQSDDGRGGRSFNGGVKGALGLVVKCIRLRSEEYIDE